MREKEEIPPSERLYRAIAGEQVEDGELLPVAIDLAETSVARHKFVEGNVRYVLTTAGARANKNYTGVASIAPEEFPQDLKANDVDYFYRAEDEPHEDDEAHAHIVLCRVSNSRPHKPGSKKAKAELRWALSSVFTIEIEPT